MDNQEIDPPTPLWFKWVFSILISIVLAIIFPKLTLLPMLLIIIGIIVCTIKLNRKKPLSLWTLWIPVSGIFLSDILISFDILDSVVVYLITLLVAIGSIGLLTMLLLAGIHRHWWRALGILCFITVIWLELWGAAGRNTPGDYVHLALMHGAYSTKIQATDPSQPTWILWKNGFEDGGAGDEFSYKLYLVYDATDAIAHDKSIFSCTQLMGHFYKVRQVNG